MTCSVVKRPGALFLEECNLAKLENKYLNKGVFIVESSGFLLFISNTNSELKQHFRCFLDDLIAVSLTYFLLFYHVTEQRAGDISVVISKVIANAIIYQR